MKYSKHFSTKSTPQTEPIPGKKQVANSAGGFSFPVDKWTQLNRFLILGSEGGSYYATERKLTKENAKNVLACIKEDGLRVVQTIVELSQAGRAPKNDPALFALALASAEGSEDTRRAAFQALAKVARIGTHLFHFAEYRQAFGGWGRGMKRAVGQWYLNKKADNLALQVVKYQSREGWSHRDLLRLSHPYGTPKQNLIFEYVVDGKVKKGVEPLIKVANDLKGFKNTRENRKELVQLIEKHELPREVLPTEFLAHPETWEALLPHMGLTAIIRNLGNMSKVGLLKPLSQASKDIVKRLSDAEGLKKARVHPIQLLIAMLTYKSGKGRLGKGEWTPVSQVFDALDEAFYASFGNIEPTGKNTMIALDVSGSMSIGAVAGVEGLTPRAASSAMAMVTARTEKDHLIMAFGDRFAKLNISPKMTLDSICKQTDGLPFMGTDCSLPMVYAMKEGLDIDTFIVYTDSETYAGHSHPSQALRTYRQMRGRPAKLVVVGMVSNGFTIADPEDGGMMDVVGFDTSAPNIIQDFARGVAAKP